jgi:uncharacterized membrane protein YdfJ with MMPL/SSD domain
MYDRLTRTAIAHPRAIVAAWLCGSLICGAIAAGVPGNVATDGVSVPGSESTRAEQVERRYFPNFAGPAFVIILTTSVPGTEFQQREAIATAVAPVSRLHGLRFAEIVETATYREDGGSRVGTLAVYVIDLGLPYLTAERLTPTIEARLRRPSAKGVSFALYGEAAEAFHDATLLRHDLLRTELIALPLAFCMLVIAFLSITAALLPMLMAACALICSLAVVHVVSLAFGLSVFVVNTASAVALGLSIDYALIVVTRFREERELSPDLRLALDRAMQTAGRAILLSGLTVAALLLAVMAIGVSLFTSMALGGIVASLSAVLAATTLLPASLALLDGRLERLSFKPAVEAARRGSFWPRLARVVTGHPRIAALASTTVLLALAVPALSLKLAFDSSALWPADSAAAREERNVEAAFGPGALGLLEVVTRDRRRATAILGTAPDKRGIWKIYEGKDGWSDMYVVLRSGPESTAAHEAVKRLRREFHEHHTSVALVGGVTAGELDLASRVTARLPVVVALALIIGLLALALGLRSIVLPIKAMACSALSVLATLGVLQLCFPSAGEGAGIAFFVPLLTFALLLGLSIDYEVFLLSRLREPATAGLSTASATSHSLTRTARPITLAGLVVITVFATFILSPLQAVQELGVAVTFGVLLDITLVRWVLSPACVVLAGRKNWWWPRARRQV